MKNNFKNIETLFRIHYEMLHRYAFTIIKDSDKANDIVQTVFLKLLEKKELIQFQRSAKAYLFRSIYNQCINQIKLEKSLSAKEKEYLASQIEENNFSDSEETIKVIREKIDRILNQLPPQCQSVFIKSRAEQKKYKEIAAELGISVKTVEAHMSKALKLIRASLRVLIVIFCLLIEWKYRLW